VVEIIIVIIIIIIIIIVIIIVIADSIAVRLHLKISKLVVTICFLTDAERNKFVSGIGIVSVWNSEACGTAMYLSHTDFVTRK